METKSHIGAGFGPVRVLILWADNLASNLGVQVLAQGMASLARMAWGPDTIVDFQDFKGAESDVAFNKKTLLRDAFLPGSPIMDKVARYDVVLDSGAGDSFTDIYGIKRMAAIMYTQNRVIASPARFVFGPQTIGPFNSRWSRGAAKVILRRADAILVRDSSSHAYANSLGRTPGALATDVTFALPAPGASTAGRDVILNVSGLLWGTNRHVDHRAYREGIVRLSRELRDAGREVTLIAHVLNNPTADNDVPAVRAAAAALGRSVEVIIPASLDEARVVIANSRLVIGARMHACLNAISVGVPTIPWAYSRKFAPLMGDLGWRHLVDLRSSADPATATLDLLDEVECTESRIAAASIPETARAVLRLSADHLAEHVRVTRHV